MSAARKRQPDPANPETQLGAFIEKFDAKDQRLIRMESASRLAQPEVEALVAAAIERARKPLPTSGRGKLIIRSISAKQQPRRRPAK